MATLGASAKDREKRRQKSAGARWEQLRVVLIAHVSNLLN